MALITCTECGNQISEYALSCPSCGFPIDKDKVGSENKRGFHESFDNQYSSDSIILDHNFHGSYEKNFSKNTKVAQKKSSNKSVALLLFLIFIILISISIFKLNKSMVPNEEYQAPINNHPISDTQSAGEGDNFSKSSSYSNDNSYRVKKEDIFAATSKSNYDLMLNCLVDNDKQALQTMILYGQVVILHRNDVIFLEKSALNYSIVRRPGDTELLYVDQELIEKR